MRYIKLLKLVIRKVYFRYFGADKIRFSVGSTGNLNKKL